MQTQLLDSHGMGHGFEGYLFPKPPSSSVLDIRRITKAADELDHCRDLTLAALIALFAVLVVGYATPTMVLIVIAALLDAFAYSVLYFRQRGKKYDLPVRDFLVAERTWITMRIRILTRSKNWATAPILAALTFFILASRISPIRLLLSVIGMAALWAVIQVIHHVNVRKPLLERLTDINRRLAEYDAGTT
jgi:hypothetical protein